MSLQSILSGSKKQEYKGLCSQLLINYLGYKGIIATAYAMALRSDDAGIVSLGSASIELSNKRLQEMPEGVSFLNSMHEEMIRIVDYEIPNKAASLRMASIENVIKYAKDAEAKLMPN